MRLDNVIVNFVRAISMRESPTRDRKDVYIRSRIIESRDLVAMQRERAQGSICSEISVNDIRIALADADQPPG